MLDQKKLFFIIAPDRSGTSLLQEIMNTFSNFSNRLESRIAGPESDSCVAHARPLPADPGGIELRCVDQALQAGRERAERHDQLLHQGRDGWSGTGSVNPPGLR